MKKINTKKKTHEEFMRDFKEKRPDLDGKLEICSIYKNSDSYILVKDANGYLRTTPRDLLYGKTPQINSAIDKPAYFKRRIENIFNGDIIVASDYKCTKEKVLTIDKYGVCSVSPDGLVMGCPPTIKTAVNKTAYAIAQFKEVHGELYDYSNFVFNGGKAYTNAKCRRCGKILDRTSYTDHLSGKGCIICNNLDNSIGFRRTQFIEKANEINNGMATLYIIKCYNKDESFYKIGVTTRSVELRFNNSTKMPYDYVLIKQFNNEAGLIYDLENKIQKINKKYKYIPSIKFGGSKRECFSEYDSFNIKDLV